VAAGLALLLLTLVAVQGEAQRRAGHGRPSVSRSGPAATGSIRGDRHRQRGSAQRHRQESRRDAQSDRREFRQDVHKERREYHEDRSRRRRARAITASAFRSLNCARETVIVNGVAYYRCGTTWYNQAYSGGSITYVIVTAPQGY
jgi:hypothetical protein